MASLVKGFVIASYLPDKDKSKASKDLESCFESDWTIPSPPLDYQDQNKTIPEGIHLIKN